MNSKPFEKPVSMSLSELVALREKEVQKILITSLESINHEKLQLVFDRELKKYGVDKVRKLLPKSQFKMDLSSDHKNIAQYREKTQTIHISPHWVYERFNTVDMKIATCMIACHEQTHFMSYTACQIISENETEQVILKQLGVDEYYTHISKNNDLEPLIKNGRLFVFLNEGITEMFSREILREYLKEDLSYSTKESVDIFFKELPHLELAYNKVIPVVEELIRSVSYRVGINMTTVKEALYGAMLHGESISDPVLVQAFDEMFGNGFTQKFAYQDIKQDTAEILSHLSQ